MGGTAGQRRAEKLERDTAKADGAAKDKSKAEEDAYWAAAGEGSKSKAQAKREAAEANADAAAASKAEAKRLAKLEEEELANLGKKSAGKKKMTKAELAALAEMDAKARLKAKFSKAKETKKEMSEEEYAAIVDVKNDNLAEQVDASGIDAAVEAMSALGVSGGGGGAGGGGGGGPPGTMNMKAAYAAFEEQEMPRLKEGRPGLKMSQYKEALFKLWKKSPMNPQNYPQA